MTGTAPEVRLALVLNGGVSLAVWMGGVTHEIDLLRRASRVAGGASEESVGGVAAHDRAVFDRWVDFCRQQPFGDVVVDVIAGTSAGGLNGTLLATAVARGVPLDPPSAASGPWLREVWLRDATLEEGKLLRRPDEPALPSVLDGSFFRDTIDTALGELCPVDGSPFDPEPVTLFVTATALGRSDRAFRDSFGQPFDVADHRRLYRFVRGGQGSSAYDPTGSDQDRPDGSWWRESVPDVFATGADPAALANAARASASFPFAFEPVAESAGLAARRVLPPAAVEPTGGRWLVDGGLLDNAPMQPVLDAITRRPLTGPMRRLLIYVVPSGGTAGAARAPAADPPSWVPIGSSAVTFPGEADLRDDIALAEQLVTAAEGSTAAPEARFEDTVTGTDRAMLTAAVGLLPQYRAARLVGGLLDVRASLAAAQLSAATELVPRSVGADAMNLLDGAVPWLPGPDADLDGAYDAVDWDWGLGAAERVVRLLARDLRDRYDNAGPSRADDLAEISLALNRIEAVRDAVRQAIIADAATAPAGDADLVHWTAKRFDRLHVTAALGWCVRTAAESYDRSLPAPRGPAGVLAAGLAVEVATQAFTAYQPFQRTAPFEFLRLGPDVETPLVDRESTDSAAARDAGAGKLYGTRLRHFAAFGLPAWRRWDWCAGRLDAQTHLARALGGGPAADAWTAETQQATVAAELGIDAATWRQRRAELQTTTDGALLTTLRSDPAGDHLVGCVVDAAMRALPEPLALGERGQILNALLARKPRPGKRPLWTRFARPVTRIVWRRKVGRLGRPG
jgi:predicted acylesterase/phospholipase RssA